MAQFSGTNITIWNLLIFDKNTWKHIIAQIVCIDNVQIIDIG